MKKTIGIVFALLIAISGAFALTEKQATTQCDDYQGHCVVFDRQKVNGYEGGKFMYGVNTWTWFPLKNGEDFDRFINGNIMTKEISVKKLSNQYKAKIMKDTVYSPGDMDKILNGKEYNDFATKLSGPHIGFRLSVQERQKVEAENPKADTRCYYADCKVVVVAGPYHEPSIKG